MQKRVFIAVVLVLLAVPTATTQDLQEGLAAYNRGDFNEAMKDLRPLALKQDAIAQYKLAFMYLRGEGAPQDDAKGVEWFRKAAEQGHTKAQYNLAIMYHIGLGVRANPGEAAKWFRRAAEQGHVEAKVNLDYMREKDLIVASVAPSPATPEEIRVQSGAKETDRSPATKTAAAPSGARSQAHAKETVQPETTKVPPAPGEAHAKVTARKNGRPEATTNPPEPARRDFRVQLASVKVKARAVKEAGRLNRVHKTVLGSLKIVPVRADLGKRGIVYRLRTGPLYGRDTANSLCRKLSARKQGCIVTNP